MKYYKFFAEYLPDLKDSTSKQKVLCCFHEESDASLSIDLEKGLYFCHSCRKGGDIYKWYMHWHKCNFKEAKYEITGDARIPILSETEVEEAHSYLTSNKKLMEAISFKRGWSTNTIIKFQLGWIEREKRLQIPIRDEHDKLINIRKYDLFHNSKKNKFLGVRGHNSPYFFPIKNLIDPGNKIITLFAGEPDTILACQFNIIGGTFTGGEGSFNRELLPAFKDKLVYICYDKDLAGTRASKGIGKELMPYAEEVKIIDLPFGRG